MTSVGLPLGSRPDLPLNFTTLFMQPKARALKTTYSTEHLWLQMAPSVGRGGGCVQMGWGGFRGDPSALSLGFSLSEFFPWLTRYIFFLGITQFNHSPTATLQLCLGAVLRVG